MISRCFKTAVALYLMFFLSTSSRAELFIFTPDKNKSSGVYIQSVNDSRIWYSPIRFSMPDLTYGDCLSVAEVASQILPTSEWVLKLDPLAQIPCVSWNTLDHQWYSILRAIDEQNYQLNIWINHDEKVIAWSDSLLIAKHLAHRENRIWRLFNHRSLQNNIKTWTDLLGWQLIWRTPSDYPVMADSIFFGDIFQALANLIEQFNQQKRSNEQGAKLIFSVDQQNKIIAIGRSHKELVN